MEAESASMAQRHEYAQCGVSTCLSNDTLRGLPRKDLWMLQYALDASEMEDPFEYSKELDPEVLEADRILVCVRHLCVVAAC